MEQPTKVVDDTERNRFVLAGASAGDDVEAELVYRVDGDRLILVHTSVPEELSGRGIGGRLVRAALERATRTGEIVVPRCEFARGWLEAHPDALGEVTFDWTPRLGRP